MASAMIDDLTLMAYADGEADAASVARIEAALATDPALAARLRAFQDSRAAAQAGFAAALGPVPPALEAAVRRMAETPATNVVAFAPRPRARLLPMALAASIALAVGLGAGWLAGNPPGAHALHIAALDDPAFLDALGTLPSGERRALPGGSSVTAIASFRDGAGALCRELEHDRADGQTLVAVACAEGGAWSVRLAVAAGAEGGYAPASSLDTLDAWLVSTEAGAPLTEEEEAAALGAM